MKTIYIIAPYPRAEAPSQRFRFEQYLDFLESEGFTLHFHPFINEKTWNTIYSEGKVVKKIIGMLGSFLRRWVLLLQLHKADYVFIHREAAQMGPPIFEWIIAKVLRKKYIYDFDDAIWLPNYSESNAKFHSLKAYWKVKYCMKWAHKITAGNAYLADFAKQYNANVQVLPTTIDTEHYHNQTIHYEKEKLVIGWTGSHTTLHYLDELVPVLQQLEKKFDFTFTVISNEAPVFSLKSLQFVKWTKVTEIEELLQFSIGVMPLKEDQWSKGKCGFKALQYMSLGIPSVISPVGVNSEIIANGENGFTPSSLSEWTEALEKLLTDRSLRHKLGMEGQATIEKRYSVHSQKQHYLNLFQ
ncbi:MAG: glycosyltransferase family 4 protein [Crocinitomicaceae bacterium]|nr:glycosyltransferase family 4 protein [Crocinitomicaceae bacterium]